MHSTTPDVIMTGGVIHTMGTPLRERDEMASVQGWHRLSKAQRAGRNAWWETVSALAIHNGHIVAVGDDNTIAALAGPGTKHIKLEGATVIPGFNDSHMHLWKEGMLLSQVNARPAAAPSIDALIEAYHVRAQQTVVGHWIEGRGYDENRLPEKRHPTRHDLDKASRHHPIVLGRTCGHIIVANSMALRLAGIDRNTPDPVGGEIERDAQGEPTGVLRETAMALVRTVQPPPSEDSLRAAIVQAGQRCLALGITSVADPGVDQRLVGVYQQLDQEAALPIRCDVMAMTISPTGERFQPPTPHVGHHLKVDTCKLFSDGGLSGGTAAISIPYQGRHDCGFPRFPAHELQTEIEQIYHSGNCVAVHSIGDHAIEMVLDAFEACRGAERLSAGRIGSKTTPRLRIEHFGLPNNAQLRRARGLNVLVATQPVFLSDLGDSILRYLPEPLVPQCYPFRSMLEAGLTVGFGSDGPVVTRVNPMEGLKASVSRTSPSGRTIAPEQCIDMAQALWCYTAGSAQVTSAAAPLGCLSPGYVADLAVLTADPLTVPLEKVLEIQVMMTMVAGRVVFEA